MKDSKKSKKTKQPQVITEFSRREQALFRLLAGQELHILPSWGITQMNKVLFLQGLSSNHTAMNDMCQEEKSKTQNTLIYTRGKKRGEYTLQGQYDNMDNVPKNSLAVVNMSGMMMVNDAMCNYGMASMDTRMRTLYRDSRIDGIVVSVNTGGGQSTAGDLLFNTISDRNKPVVTHALFMASAGVKGTLKSDEIIAASRSTTIGSIGTMMVMPKWYIESSKENDIELYAGTSPNKNAPWRAIKNGDVEPYIKYLTKIDQQFMAEVTENRNLKGSKATIENTLSGEVFPAIEAKSRGLVDGIGSLNHALKRLDSHIS